MDENKNSNEKVSFISIILSFFRRKKRKVIVVKKKKKKEFVAVNVPIDNNDSLTKEDSIEEKEKKPSNKNKIPVVRAKSRKRKKEEAKNEVINDNYKDNFNNGIDNIKNKSKDNVKDNINDKILDTKVDNKKELNEKKDVLEEEFYKSDNYVYAGHSIREKKIGNTNDKLLENKIILVLDDYLKEKKYQVNKYISLYKEYKNEFDNLSLYNEVCEASTKVDILLDKINKLKKELGNIDNINDIDDNYIKHLIEMYKIDLKNSISSNILDSNDLNEKYISIIGMILEIDATVDKLNDDLENKKDVYKGRDKDFDTLKKTFYENDKTFELIKFMIKENERLLDELEYKVANSKKVFVEVEKVYKKVNNNLSILLLGYMAIKRNPSISKTVKIAAFTSVLFESFRSMFNSSNVEYQTRKRVVVEDYEKEIIDGLKSVDDIFKLLDKTMVNIVDMRRDFEKKFSEYNIPEYNTFLKQLDDLSDNLSERRDYLKNTKKEFNYELEKNKVMIKKIDYTPYDEENGEVEDRK